MKKLILLVAAVVLCQTLFAQRVALVREDGKFGYINTDGSWLIEPSYKGAYNFSNGLAAVDGDKVSGFIDSSGSLVIEKDFDKVKRFDSGLALVSKDKRWYYIDKKGEEVEMPASDKKYSFVNGLAYINRDGKIGLINAQGEIVLEPKYSKILKFYNGHASVKLGESWGLIDTKGNEVLKTEFQQVGHYSEGVVPVKKDNSFGLMINGVFTKVDGATKIWNFNDGENLTIARNDDKLVGFVDRTGKWAIKPIFTKVKEFSFGLAPVINNNGKLWSYINESGEVVIEAKYRDAEIFSADELAPVKISKLWGFINRKGELVIEDIYIIKSSFGGLTFIGSDVSISRIGFSNGISRVGFKKQWGFINTKGEVLNDTWYQNAENFVNIE